MEIRKASNKDINLLSRLEKECFVDSWNSTMIKSSMENIGEFYIAEINDIVVGYYCVMNLDTECELLRICISKQYRKKGLGTQLMKKFVSYSQTRGWQKIFLEVSDQNSIAIDMYKKLNFDTVTKRKNYYSNGDDALMMVKYNEQ